MYLFPNFHGLVGEDPRKHLKEFHGEDPRKHLKEFHGTRSLISNIQFGVRGFAISGAVNELAIEQHHICLLVRVCGICASVEHPTDTCPNLQETELNSAKVTAMMGGQ
ncbi:hypothetical protein CR513_02688, partial [Mucuna pruriens]